MSAWRALPVTFKYCIYVYMYIYTTDMIKKKKGLGVKILIKGMFGKYENIS